MSDFFILSDGTKVDTEADTFDVSFDEQDRHDLPQTGQQEDNSHTVSFDSQSETITPQDDTYTLSFSKEADITCADLETRSVTFKGLADLLGGCPVTDDKTKTGYFIRGDCGTYRKGKNLQSVELLILDADAGISEDGEIVPCPPPEQAHEALQKLGWTHIIYTSYSHCYTVQEGDKYTKDGYQPGHKLSRYRIVIPCKMNVQDIGRATDYAFERINAQLEDVKIKPSSESKTAAQAWFLPAAPKDRQKDFYSDWYINKLFPLQDVPAAVADRARIKTTVPDGLSPIAQIHKEIDDEMILSWFEDHGYEWSNDGEEGGKTKWRLLHPNSTTGIPGGVLFWSTAKEKWLYHPHNGNDPLNKKADHTDAGTATLDCIDIFAELELDGDKEFATEILATANWETEQGSEAAEETRVITNNPNKEMQQRGWITEKPRPDGRYTLTPKGIEEVILSTYPDITFDPVQNAPVIDDNGRSIGDIEIQDILTRLKQYTTRTELKEATKIIAKRKYEQQDRPIVGAETWEELLERYGQLAVNRQQAELAARRTGKGQTWKQQIHDSTWGNAWTPRWNEEDIKAPVPYWWDFAGNGVLVADSGIGKTWLVIAMLLHGLQPRKKKGFWDLSENQFLDANAKKRRIAYIAAEGMDSVERRMVKMAKQLGIPQDVFEDHILLHRGAQLKGTDKDGRIGIDVRGMIRDCIETPYLLGRETDLIIFDTQSAVGAEVNNATEWTPVQNVLFELEQCGVNWWFLHHGGRGNTKQLGGRGGSYVVGKGDFECRIYHPKLKQITVNADGTEKVKYVGEPIENIFMIHNSKNRDGKDKSFLAYSVTFVNDVPVYKRVMDLPQERIRVEEDTADELPPEQVLQELKATWTDEQTRTKEVLEGNIKDILGGGRGTVKQARTLFAEFRDAGLLIFVQNKGWQMALGGIEGTQI